MGCCVVVFFPFWLVCGLGLSTGPAFLLSSECRGWAVVWVIRWRAHRRREVAGQRAPTRPPQREKTPAVRPPAGGSGVWGPLRPRQRGKRAAPLPVDNRSSHAFLQYSCRRRRLGHSRACGGGTLKTVTRGPSTPPRGRHKARLGPRSGLSGERAWQRTAVCCRWGWGRLGRRVAQII